MNQELICTGCPMGCRLLAVVEGDRGETPVVIEVTGNFCPRGADYARTECTNPLRTLTTTVVIQGAMYPLLSVRTTKPVPKGLIKSCMNDLRRVHVKAPVKAGEVIVKNILNTGADIIATKDLERIKTVDK